MYIRFSMGVFFLFSDDSIIEQLLENRPNEGIYIAQNVTLL